MRPLCREDWGAPLTPLPSHIKTRPPDQPSASCVLPVTSIFLPTPFWQHHGLPELGRIGTLPGLCRAIRGHQPQRNRERIKAGQAGGPLPGPPARGPCCLGLSPLGPQCPLSAQLQRPGALCYFEGSYQHLQTSPLNASTCVSLARIQCQNDSFLRSCLLNLVTFGVMCFL